MHNKLIKYFEENQDVFIEVIEELDSYMGYLGDNRYYYMDELDDIFYGLKPSELLNRFNFSKFNLYHEYFYFDGYGNICSDYEKDYSCYLDNYFIDTLIEYKNHLYLPDEVNELLDEYDENNETEV